MGGKKEVALLYDAAMREHRTPAGHPESPERAAAIERLWAPEGSLSGHPRPSVKPVTLDFLSSIHDKNYLLSIEATRGKEFCQLDPDTYTSPRSVEAALLAAGCAVAATDAVLGEGLSYAFAFGRPPGHHAEIRRAMGFCLFNNAGAAATQAFQKYGLKRVMILDWDVHHGNGTQDVFYERSDVLFLSCHQFPFYPGTGNFMEIGSGAGKGFSVNLPMSAGMGDVDFQALFETSVTQSVLAYKPELIIISAGYDAHRDDPVGGQSMSNEGFSRLTRIMMDLAEEVCKGRLVFVLEGGYNLRAVPQCIAATVETLDGRRKGDRLAGNSSDLIEEIHQRVLAAHGGAFRSAP